MCYCGAHSNKDGKCSPDKENPEKGYCHSCSKFFDLTGGKKEYTPRPPEPPKPTSYHPFKMMEASLGYTDNFTQFMSGVFGQDLTDKAAKTYYVGASKFWKGATIFWQLDEVGRIRYGKVMLYDTNTGKRVKEPFNHFTNVHSILKLKDFNHKQCLFGLHLLPDNKKPIALVESEKTAVIMSIVDNSYLWLATGGKGNFNHEFLKPLKGKSITAFPDAGETIWEDVAERLNKVGFDISISDVLNGKEKGYDLADAVLEEMAFVQPPQPEPKQYHEYTREERLQCGLTAFADSDLKKLAGRLFSEKKQMRWSALAERLQELESLQEQDAEDLIDVLSIKKIIKYDTDTYLYSM
ncbi:MAG: DUF6371 domain-containing protein [Weeksellaceae bacterium]|nr:DUF6371 domain-containing protein [Weeksellaceae bacterium]